MRSRTSPPTKLTETQKPVHESMIVRVKVKSSELEGVHCAESIAPGPPAVAEPSALIVPTLYHKDMVQGWCPAYISTLLGSGEDFKLLSDEIG